MKANEKPAYKGFGRIFTEALVIAVAILLLLALLAPLLGQILGGRGGHRGSKISTARGAVACLGLALQMYQTEYGHPFSWDDSENDHELRNQSVFRMLISNGSYLDVRSKDVRDNTYIDPWGRAYHVAIDADNDGDVNIGEGTAYGVFAIWSEGPNQLNEFGEGDDIRSW